MNLKRPHIFSKTLGCRPPAPCGEGKIRLSISDAKDAGRAATEDVDEFVQLAEKLVRDRPLAYPPALQAKDKPHTHSPSHCERGTCKECDMYFADNSGDVGISNAKDTKLSDIAYKAVAGRMTEGPATFGHPGSNSNIESKGTRHRTILTSAERSEALSFGYRAARIGVPPEAFCVLLSSRRRSVHFSLVAMQTYVSLMASQLNLEL